MKKLKESVHAIQVGCQIYEGPRLDKDFPHNKEVKQVEDARYGEFGCTTPFNGSNRGKFRVGPPGYYTKTDNYPPYGKRRLILEELLTKHQEESAQKILKWNNALANLGASINLIPYSLYAKLSLKTFKPTKISVRLADRSFQYPVEIAENMLVEVGKFTFPIDFVILEMEEDNKVSLILGRPFLYTADAVIRVKHKQLNLRTKKAKSSIPSKEPFSKKNFFKFNEYMAMTADGNSESESDTEEPPCEKITINTNYKIKTPLKEPPTDLELKPIPDNLEYVFLEEPSFLPMIISSKLSTQNKSKLVYVLKNVRKPSLGKL
nr:reverse transcriptase domain-containing protein [Tanacetum cinerariifolium]